MSSFYMIYIEFEKFCFSGFSDWNELYQGIKMDC